MALQIRGQLTPEEFSDAIRLARPRRFWLRWAFANWYGLTILILMVGVAISALMGDTHPQWTAMFIITAIFGSLVGYSLYRALKGSAKGLRQYNEQAPDTFTLDDKGLVGSAADGSNTSQPWTSLNSWRRGGQVLVLTTSRGAIHVLPVGETSAAAAQPFIETLRSRLGEAL